MQTGIRAATSSLIFYVIAKVLIETMVTGTSDGDVMIQDVGPILAAIVVLFTFIGLGFRSGGSD